MGMAFEKFRTSRLAQGGFFFVLFAAAGFASAARAGLSEADRVTLEQPACAQMRSFSQDITLLNDEMQNVRRSPNRRRLCDVLERTVTTIGNTVDYMQSH